MSLQDFLTDQFKSWRPKEPEVMSKTKYSVTLHWVQEEPFGFLADQLLYKIEKDNKIPPWITVYSGGKTTKEIDNLAPRHPHKFRLKVILKTTAVPTLAVRAIQFHGDEEIVYEKMKRDPKASNKEKTGNDRNNLKEIGIGDAGDSKSIKYDENESDKLVDDGGDKKSERKDSKITSIQTKLEAHPWLESQWSDEAWANTDTDGTSIICFCMAVRCGYIKQVQGMLDERPELLDIINSSNGFTPLATAVRKGDINTVRFLLSAGADIDQACSTGQTPLHLAVFAVHMQIVELLLDKGADFQASDLNGLHVEHYAVDSGDLKMLAFIMDKGGDVKVEDNNGWTPLFRAMCQGAKTEIIEELIIRGSDVNAVDKAGLPLTSVARLLTNRHGRNRDSVLRLVDVNYPHEVALANFTRLTKKIYNVRSLFKLPGLNNKANLRN